jgi:thioesterase domain-containing protein
MSTIRPYRGMVTLVAAARRLASDPLLDPLCGWKPLLPNLLVHSVDADHLSILEGVKVGETVTAFRKGQSRALKS